jgi:hypothetical protein
MGTHGAIVWRDRELTCYRDSPSTAEVDAMHTTGFLIALS